VNLGELKTAAALQFGDPDMTHVTDSQWTSIANMGERELAAITLSISTRITNTALTAETQRYVLSTLLSGYDVIQVIRILNSDDQELFSRTESELNDIHGNSFRNADSGNPESWYMTDTDDSIGFYPKPSAQYISNYSFDVIHLPTADMLTDVDNPQLPVVFHDCLVLYMVHRGYLIDNDRERAAGMMGLLRSTLQGVLTTYKHRKGKVDPRPAPDFTKFSD
jgi:hypothetical protein